MNINHRLTKKEITDIYERFKGDYKVFLIINKSVRIIMYIVLAFTIYNVFKNLIFTQLIDLFVNMFVIISAIWIIMVNKRNFKYKKTLSYTKILERYVTDDIDCKITADETGVTVNDAFKLNWKEIIIAFLCEDYVILGSEKRKIAIILKTAPEDKSEISKIMYTNKASIFDFSKNNQNAEYMKAINKRKRKRYIPLFIFVYFTLILILTNILFNFFENNKYDPKENFGVQMAAAIDDNRIPGFKQDRNDVMEIYYQYICQNFDTVIKISRSDEPTKELWFLKENSFDRYIVDVTELPYVDAGLVVTKHMEWQFAELTDFYQLEDLYPNISGFSAHHNSFTAEFSDDNGNLLLYQFGQNYINCTEIKGNEHKNLFTVILSNTPESEKDEVNSIMSRIHSDARRSAEVENADFEKMCEIMDKYSSIELIG